MEMLTVLIIIGIIAAIALPNFFAAKKKAQTAEVRGNMHTTQTAAESYATDSGGVYGATANIMPYYPSGSLKLGGTPGDLPNNPVTGAFNEPPITGGPVTSTEIMNLRQQPSSAFGSAGRHSYDVADNGQSYSICGCDANSPSGHITGPGGKVLVLSNQ